MESPEGGNNNKANGVASVPATAAALPAPNISVEQPTSSHQTNMEVDKATSVNGSSLSTNTNVVETTTPLEVNASPHKKLKLEEAPHKETSATTPSAAAIGHEVSTPPVVVPPVSIIPKIPVQQPLIKSEPPIKPVVSSAQQQQVLLNKSTTISSSTQSAYSTIADKVKTNTKRKAAEDSSRTTTTTITTTKEPTMLEEVVSKYVTLAEIPRRPPSLPKLTAADVQELEVALQVDPTDEEEGWPEDWCGNLALLNKDISNPTTKRRKPQRQEVTQAIWEWAKASSSITQGSTNNNNNNLCVNLGRKLLAHVYHLRDTPPTAKRLVAQASHDWDKNPSFDIFEAIKRTTYDPAVLREDGWTTMPTDSAGATASGGPIHIGKKVIWQSFEAVICAYVLDPDMGDLWKGMWIDGFETFDLEADELQKAVAKWERKNKKMESKRPHETSRTSAVKDITIEGIEYGIILATTYHPNARQGVFWPARVMHASELSVKQTQTKRASSKQKVNVVFLAPYWNNDDGPNRAATLSSSPLFQMESIDVSYDTLQRYPHDGHNGINIHQLRIAFRFTGLPKKAFERFLQSHRLATALKQYAQDELVSTTTTTSKTSVASAALFDTHQLSITTARFPPALIQLPFRHLLSKLPAHGKDGTNNDENNIVEPSVNLASIMKSFEPPLCYGQADEGNSSPQKHNGTKTASLMTSPTKPVFKKLDSSVLGFNFDIANVKQLLSEFMVAELKRLQETDLPSATLLGDLERLLNRAGRVCGEIIQKGLDEKTKRFKLRSLLHECLRLKFYGEDTLASDGALLGGVDTSTLTEWRRACERLFKHVTVHCSTDGFGNGVTMVLSDSKCNQHITKSGCVERPVRLPAAIKACKTAGAGASPAFQLKIGVEEQFVKLAADKFLEKAHSPAYLKKMRSRTASLSPGMTGANLTEGSDGEGGCDTTGSRGTFDAAVAGVAAAMSSVDMIVGGQCVNAFCATRPPGHHAGRDLHPMGAVSNGFCILNPVAVAAIYATTPPSEGGLGLKRAAVIDFDVHHGNGTEDILCSTYDPRFLYVSIHAGGAQINGYETDDSDMDFTSYSSSKKQQGIFPGRCGDSSPHKGVLNIPLGARVTPHDVGNALVTRVEPAVEEFSPDIIILSAGFDGHKHDPLGMGGLAAHDFGHITEVACGLAFRCCSGRILSVMEGGYGVPCCRPQTDCFLPPPSLPTTGTTTKATRPQPSKLMELGIDLPNEMDDQVTPGMQRKLEKCHTEGFADCVREHVASLRKNNCRS